MCISVKNCSILTGYNLDGYFCRDAGRVVFFCPERELVEQQFGSIKDQFPEYDVEFLLGSNVADKMAIEVMVRTHQVRYNSVICVTCVW